MVLPIMDDEELVAEMGPVAVATMAEAPNDLRWSCWFWAGEPWAEVCRDEEEPGPLLNESELQVVW